MNPGAILALISELYAQVAQLSAENAQLKEALAADKNEKSGPQ